MDQITKHDILSVVVPLIDCSIIARTRLFCSTEDHLLLNYKSTRSYLFVIMMLKDISSF